MRLRDDLHGFETGDKFVFVDFTATFDWESWVPWLEQPISSSLVRECRRFFRKRIPDDYFPSFRSFQLEWQDIEDEWAFLHPEFRHDDFYNRSF